MTKKELEIQNEQLKGVIMKIWWMAKRYADGRQSYAPMMFNNAMRTAVECGVVVDPDPVDEKIFVGEGK